MSAEGAGAELLERRRETELIEELLDRAADGDGGVLFVEGPAGIGKSTLLAFAVDAARTRGIDTLTARGGELERDNPFGAVRQLFEARVHRSSGELLSGSAKLAARVFEARPDAARGDLTPPFTASTG